MGILGEYLSSWGELSTGDEIVGYMMAMQERMGTRGSLGLGTQIRPSETERKERRKEHSQGRTANSDSDSRRTGLDPGKLCKHAESQRLLCKTHAGITVRVSQGSSLFSIQILHWPP